MYVPERNDERFSVLADALHYHRGDDHAPFGVYYHLMRLHRARDALPPQGFPDTSPRSYPSFEAPYPCPYRPYHRSSSSYRSSSSSPQSTVNGVKAKRAGEYLRRYKQKQNRNDLPLLPLAHKRYVLPKYRQ